MHSDSSQILSILQSHVPSSASDYAFQLWHQKPFQLKLTRSRQTKVGDFTCKRNATHLRISLNHDLNQYLFLLTYVHEVAHLRVFLTHGHRAEAHGIEWKRTFQELLNPLLQESVFPAEILHELKRHMVNPMASSFADVKLTKVLRSFDKNAQTVTVLTDVPEGSLFRLQGRYFKKGKLRRTRVVCMEMRTKRNYLVPIDAQVTDVQLALL
jgi:SprT protein